MANQTPSHLRLGFRSLHSLTLSPRCSLFRSRPVSFFFDALGVLHSRLLFVLGSQRFPDFFGFLGVSINSCRRKVPNLYTHFPSALLNVSDCVRVPVRTRGLRVGFGFRAGTFQEAPDVMVS
jgi:hypothetical protein